jgi:hypothetical protein
MKLSPLEQYLYIDRINPMNEYRANKRKALAISIYNNIMFVVLRTIVLCALYTVIMQAFDSNYLFI